MALAESISVSALEPKSWKGEQVLIRLPDDAKTIVAGRVQPIMVQNCKSGRSVRGTHEGATSREALAYWIALPPLDARVIPVDGNMQTLKRIIGTAKSQYGPPF